MNAQQSTFQSLDSCMTSVKHALGVGLNQPGGAFEVGQDPKTDVFLSVFGVFHVISKPQFKLSEKIVCEMYPPALSNQSNIFLLSGTPLVWT